MAAIPSADLATALFFLLCTLFSIYTDVVTKDILNISRMPVTLTLAQFGVSSICGFLLLHVFRIHKSQPLSLKNVQKLAPLMGFQATGFLFANHSVASVAVSFMHTVKSSESVFTAFFSWAVLGNVYSPSVYLSLLPMIMGVSFSSMSEFSFTLWGLVSGLASNICFSGRSVYSEALFKTKLYDDVNLYWIICTGAFLVVLPLWLVVDLPLFLEGGVLPPSTSLTLFVGKLVLCGTLHYIYNMFSFMILSRTSPLTHVVLHAVRRMIVIFFSILWFGNKVTAVNVLGMALVFLGVFWYAWAKAEYNRKLHKQ